MWKWKCVWKTGRNNVVPNNPPSKTTLLGRLVLQEYHTFPIGVNVAFTCHTSLPVSVPTLDKAMPLSVADSGLHLSIGLIRYKIGRENGQLSLSTRQR